MESFQRRPSSKYSNNMDRELSMNTRPKSLSDIRIIIRGAGDLATGIACRLFRSGFFKIVMTEVESPLAVRRMVSFCEAIHEGSWVVEGITAQRVRDSVDVMRAWEGRLVPIIVDAENTSRLFIGPDVVIDAIMAKRNTGTRITDARLVIGIGPGFQAGGDVHYGVETKRGHDLGRLILDGPASPDTGIPGEIAGETSLRVIRSPASGLFHSSVDIGSLVQKGSVVGYVDEFKVEARITGILRGLIRPETNVVSGMKIGDVDPRCQPGYCSTVSDKSRAIGGAVLEAVLATFNIPRND